MTGMIVEVARRSIPIQRGILPEALREAFSPETKRIAEQVESFWKHLRSPTSLPKVADRPAKELTERLFDARVAAKVLTAAVAMHLDPAWRQKLFRQLDSLHDPDEWEDGDEPLQQSSYATFLKAMLALNPSIRPGLGLSHSGHLIAAWTVDRDRLTIEFFPNDRVRWVLARYKNDEEPSRFAGQTPVTELAEGLAPHCPEHWFSHERRKREEPSR